MTEHLSSPRISRRSVLCGGPAAALAAGSGPWPITPFCDSGMAGPARP